MYYSVLVACLSGIFFTSSGASLTVDNGVKLGQKLNESMKEQKHIIDTFAAPDMEAKIKSVLHSKQKMGSGGQAGASQIKSGTFPIESLLNMFSIHIEDNGPPTLDGKDNPTNILNNKSQKDSRIDKLRSIKQGEDHSDSLDSENNEPPSHERPPLKPDSVTVLAQDNTGYENILEEIYNDDDLQYILNITHNLNAIRQSINNETNEQLYIEESSPEHVIDIMDLEDTSKMKGEDVNDNDPETSIDGRDFEGENWIKVKNVTTRINSGDLAKKVTESTIGGQRIQQSDSTVNHDRKEDVPNVHHSTEVTSIDQSSPSAKYTTTSPPMFLEKSSDHGHDVDAYTPETNKMKLSVDPCNNFHCKKGMSCKSDGQGNPFCTCQDPEFCVPGNNNDIVCGTDNNTYTSACHLFATKCNLEGTKEGSHLHLDYQGPCKYIPPCTEYELAHFPFRMRDWLKNVLMQLYERDHENIGLLSDKQKRKVKKIYENEKRLQEGNHSIELLVKDFQKNYHMYVYPVHWQFHQLDQPVMDRLLTHSELSALRIPLVPIEHCVNAFLQQCNTNNDRYISLWEWCGCFGIKEGDINEDLLF